MMLEIAVKVAIGIALLPTLPTHTGHRMPVQQGVKASPTQTPAPTYGSVPQTNYGCGGNLWLTADQVANYLRDAGFPESAIPTMVAYAARESHYNAHAINCSSGACGLLQLYPCPGLEYLDPAKNAEGAYMKYKASGFSPWGG